MPNHSALLIGYNLNADVPFFIIKNGWGDDWGMKGFFHMKIGRLNHRNVGLCQIGETKYNIFPLMKE